ncbi:DUF1648 domain-containing protein [Clostridium sp. PL3]|uniref:DUF1648 domain-containing protein n=1 Tax=Clostridium thailandense TaxID=2794346 RepID=A0A949TYA7_9CLOT|nr:DUF5808 domain-containing protein [Clostridium thailandense]MBV7273820.1 DUF1648 domain-containing protein [Clostridium thailandense]
MRNSLISMITIVPIITIIFIIQIMMPKLTRKDIYFGIRIPEEQLENEELKKIYREYIKNNVLFFIFYILVNWFLLIYLNHLINFLKAVEIFLYLAVTFYIYYIGNKKVKVIKERNGWYKNKKSAVVVDTNFSKEKGGKMLASPWWFLIPAAIILVNVIIAFNAYNRVPETFPIHWNSLGQADNWAKKSYKSVLSVPVAQCFITIVMFFSFKIIGWSKQQISASKPEISKEQNRIFRYRWSMYLIAMAVMINLFFTFINLTTLQVIKSNYKIMSMFSISFAIIACIGSLIMSIKTGQGGSRIKIQSKEGKLNSLLDRDDDRYWKFGNSIYVNKDDPSLFVEKRFGIGWTMNFGRIESIIILVIFLIIILSMKFFLK